MPAILQLWYHLRIILFLQTVLRCFLKLPNQFCTDFKDKTMLFSTFGKLAVILIFFGFSNTNGYSIKQKSRDESEESVKKVNSEWWMKKKIRTLERELAQFEEIVGKYFKIFSIISAKPTLVAY